MFASNRSFKTRFSAYLLLPLCVWSTLLAQDWEDLEQDFHTPKNLSSPPAPNRNDMTQDEKRLNDSSSKHFQAHLHKQIQDELISKFDISFDETYAKGITHAFKETTSNIRTLLTESCIHETSVPLIQIMLSGHLLPKSVIADYFCEDKTKEQGAFSLLRLGNGILNHKNWTTPLSESVDEYKENFAAECFYVASTWFSRRWIEGMEDFQHLPHYQKSPETQYMQTLDGRIHMLSSLESLLDILHWSLYRNHQTGYADHTQAVAYDLKRVYRSMISIVSHVTLKEPDIFDVILHSPQLNDTIASYKITHFTGEPITIKELIPYFEHVISLHMMEVSPYITPDATTSLRWADTQQPITLQDCIRLTQFCINDGEQHFLAHTLPELQSKLQGIAQKFDDVMRNNTPNHTIESEMIDDGEESDMDDEKAEDSSHDEDMSDQNNYWYDEALLDIL